MHNPDRKMPNIASAKRIAGLFAGLTSLIILTSLLPLFQPPKFPKKTANLKYDVVFLIATIRKICRLKENFVVKPSTLNYTPYCQVCQI
jgi:hypothetical protein